MKGYDSIIDKTYCINFIPYLIFYLILCLCEYWYDILIHLPIH